MISNSINKKLKEIYQAKLDEVNRINIDSLPVRDVPLISFSDRTKTGKKLALIAEVKKASPSKGLIRPDFNLENIIFEYIKIKADAISVLTDERFFDGHNDFLKRVKQKTRVPVLRKDFIISEAQIYESYSMGADIILLIVAMLSLDQLKLFMDTGTKLGLDILVEAHTAAELENALAAGAKIVGINNRDLNTFKVDINNALNLAGQIPDDVIKVAESGIHKYEDIKKIEKAGFDAVLIGEAFMASNNIEAAYKQIFGK